MKTVIALALLVTACGSQDDDPAALEAPAVAVPVSAEPIAPPVDTKLAYVGSLRLASRAELPACDEERRYALVYIVSEKVFAACDGAAWLDVEIAGAAGKDGKDGEDGKDAPEVEPYDPGVWTDVMMPKTGSYARKWLFTGVATAPSSGTCSNGWRLPTADDVRLGVTHGLLAKFPAGTANYAWTGDMLTDSSGTYHVAVRLTPQTNGFGVGTSGADAASSRHMIFCVKE